MNAKAFLIAITFLSFFIFSSVSAADWEDVDTWETTIGGGGWNTVEAWATTLGIESAPPVYSWEDVTTWSTTVSAVVGQAWIDVDTWETTVDSEASYTPPGIESYDYSLILDYAKDQDDNNLIVMRGDDADYATAFSNYSLKLEFNNWRFGQEDYVAFGEYRIYRSIMLVDLTELSIPIEDASFFFTPVGSPDTHFDVGAYTLSIDYEDIDDDTTTFTSYDDLATALVNTSTLSSLVINDAQLELNETGIAYLNEHLGEVCPFMLISEETTAPGAGNNDTLDFVNSKNDSYEHMFPSLKYNLSEEGISVETWTTTLDVEEGPTTVTPTEPLIPYAQMVKLLLPICLLFIPAVALASRFGGPGFMIGLILGLVMLYITDYASLAMVLLGGFACVAIWWRMD